MRKSVVPTDVEYMPYFGEDRRGLEGPHDLLIPNAQRSGRENRILDSFRLPESAVCGPRFDKYHIRVFTELDDPEAARDAWRLQGGAYGKSGFVVMDALEDGCLPPDIDTARGPNVIYRIATSIANPADRATIRKETADNFRDLSAYKLCRDALSKEGIWALEQSEDEGYTISNVAALGTSSRLFHEGAHALFRDIVQDAQGRRERWFFGIVASTFSSLVHSYGVDTFKVIGDDVVIDDPRVRKGLTLRPTLVDVDRYFDTMVSSASEQAIKKYLDETVGPARRGAMDTARNKAVQKYLVRLMDNVEYFTDGLTRRQMSPTVYQARQAIKWSQLMGQRRDTRHDHGIPQQPQRSIIGANDTSA